MAGLSKEYDPGWTRRLVLAIVNQAIFDVLENNEAAKAAEQWLLSKDFDSCVELLNGEPESFRANQQQLVA